jgi:putative membrane protein
VESRPRPDDREIHGREDRTTVTDGGFEISKEMDMTGFIANAWHHDGPGFWIVFVLLFWVFLIGAAIVLLRSVGRWNLPGHDARRESAVDVLERRFAEGQLSVEEYRERRAVLSEERGGS